MSCVRESDLIARGFRFLDCGSDATNFDRQDVIANDDGVTLWSPYRTKGFESLNGTLGHVVAGRSSNYEYGGSVYTLDESGTRTNESIKRTEEDPNNGPKWNKLWRQVMEKKYAMTVSHEDELASIRAKADPARRFQMELDYAKKLRDTTWRYGHLMSEQAYEVFDGLIAEAAKAEDANERCDKFCEVFEVVAQEGMDHNYLFVERAIPHIEGLKDEKLIADAIMSSSKILAKSSYDPIASGTPKQSDMLIAAAKGAISDAALQKSVIDEIESNRPMSDE